MNLRALRTFVTTVEMGGLGRACARLHLSQPAASRQIHALEAELGLALFERVGRRLQLTSDGEDLLNQSRRLLDDATALLDQALSLKGGQIGTLRIGATPHVIAGVLVPFLPRYRRRYHNVEVQLLEGGATQQSTRLHRGEIHLAITPTGDERLHGRLLYPVYAFAVLRSERDSSKSRRQALEVASLASKPVLLLRREFGSREWFDAACAISHVRPQVRLESAAPQTLVELAVAGYGVAIVPSTVSVSSDKVLVLPLVQRGTPLGRWSMIAWNPQRYLPLYAQRFVDELLAYVARHAPGQKFIRHAPVMPRPVDPGA